MKKLLLISLMLSCMLSGFSQNLNDFIYLVGTWERQNTKPGRSAFETWGFDDDGMLRGKGITLKGADTVFVEKIGIVWMEGILYYVADVPENPAPVYFEMIAVDETGFTCQNLDHDFPKQIQYRLDGGFLRATISGNGKEIPYVFLWKD